MGTFRVKLDARSSSTVPLSPDGLGPEPIFAIFNFNIPPFYTTSDTTAAEYMSVLDNSDLNIGGIFQGILGSSPVTANFQTGNAIILDGNEGNPLTFNGLPAGFKVITAKVVIRVMAQQYSVGVSVDLFLKQGNVSESSPFSVPIDITLHTYEFPFVDVTSALDVLTGGCGFRIVPVDAVVSFTYLYITGTYETQGFSWTIDTNSPVSVGNPVSISSFPSPPQTPNLPPEFYDSSLSDPPPLNLLDVDHIEIHFLDGAGDPQSISVFPVDFTFWTWYNITFILPDFGGETPPVFTVVYVDNGRQFTGSVPLGTLLTIFFTDGSGIYKLVEGKTNDTLYVQDADPITTVDVKIPDPFAKLGFIP